MAPPSPFMTAASKAYRWLFFTSACCVSVVEGCTSCGYQNTVCLGGCSNAGSSIADIQQYLTFMSSCTNSCTIQLLACCPSAAGGDGDGGGGGGGDETDAVLQLCDATAGTANADGNTVLSLEEYKAHAEVVASQVCPQVARTEEYYTGTDFAEQFSFLSCALCMGLYDPFNPLAQDGTYENCGCGDATASRITPIIDLASLTRVEAMAYCANVFGMAFVDCHQPERTCFQTCSNELSTCTDACIQREASSRDFVVKCLDACTPQFYECTEQCTTTNAFGGTAAGIGDGSGGGGRRMMRG